MRNTYDKKNLTKGLIYLLLIPLFYYLLHFPAIEFLNLITADKYINTPFEFNTFETISLWPFYLLSLLFFVFVISASIGSIIFIIYAILMSIIDSARNYGAWIGIQLGFWVLSKKYMKEMQIRSNDPNYLFYYQKNNKHASHAQELKEILLGLPFVCGIIYLTLNFISYLISSGKETFLAFCLFSMTILFIILISLIKNKKEKLSNLLYKISYLGSNGPKKTVKNCSAE